MPASSRCRPTIRALLVCPFLVPWFSIIDREHNPELLGYASVADLVAGQREWVAAWQDAHTGREIGWSESVAVGREDFVDDIQTRLDIRARHRQADEDTDRFILHESRASYTTISEGRNQGAKRQEHLPMEAN